jgi:hypothetical protein
MLQSARRGISHKRAGPAAYFDQAFLYERLDGFANDGSTNAVLQR